MRESSIPLLLLAVLALVLGSACGGEEATPEKPQTPYGVPPYAAPPGTGAPRAGLDAELLAEVVGAHESGRGLLAGVQAEDGGFGDPAIQLPANVGYTAMAVSALVASAPPTEVAGDARIRAGLDWLKARQKEDGSIWDDPRFVTYMTSAAVGALATARIPAYREVQKRAMEFLADSQIAGGESDPSYGGFPYKQGQGQPADLSNFQFALTALADAGLPKDHPVWERSLVYLARVQNRSESNTFRAEREIDGRKVTVVSGDDGGAIYHPGESKAALVERSDGLYEARSYGSMTYALLKCLLLAGVPVDDPRVVAALGWLSRNFTVERNPGFEAAADAEKAGQQGYYYFVFTMARALAEYERVAAKPLAVTDPEGRARDWRSELSRELLDRRRADGWWVNEASDRWDEGSRVLATSYALLALAEAAGR